MTGGHPPGIGVGLPSAAAPRAAVSAVGPGAVVEVATWCPIEAVDVSGWRVGFSGGFTRRANSVLADRAPTDVGSAIVRVEELYAQRGLPARFRVCGAARPEDLDTRLSSRGYRLAATTHVMVRDVPTAGAGTAGSATGEAEDAPVISAADTPDEAWLSGWLDVKASGVVVDRGVARAVVTGSPASYLTARDGSGVVGVMRVAFAGDWLALSSLMIAPRARRRGLAQSLTRSAMALGARRGTHRAFLQVEATNLPAIGLYELLGFTHVETYHYRER